jgi:hypothetical protein
MRRLRYLSQARTASGANAFLGAWLFWSPWIFADRSGGSSFWADLITGSLIGVLAFMRALWPRDAIAFSWANLFLGGWAALLPWTLDFLSDAPRAWNSVIVGTSVLLFGALSIHGTSAHRARRHS